MRLHQSWRAKPLHAHSVDISLGLAVAEPFRYGVECYGIPYQWEAR